MAAPKAPPAKPVLENFHNVRAAAARLGLRDGDNPDDHRGEDWLRKGVNRPADGSKGEPFPHTRMAGQLMFSDSDLAWIAEHGRETPHGHAGRPSNNRRPRRRPPAKKSAA